GVTVKHDEIRLGETWPDVLGGPPTFAVQPANQVAFAGQTVVFITPAQTVKPTQYPWYRAVQAIANETNTSLTLPGIALFSANDYSVIASNELGAATSQVAHLTVQLLGISVPTQSMTAGAGTNIVLSASTTGSAPISFQWFKDGAALSGQTNATLALNN